VAHLATIGARGSPDLVPVTFALVDRTLYSAVDHKPKRTRELARLANIERDPRVTLLADRYDDTWSKLWWVRLRGDASTEHDGADFEAGIEALTAKYEPYQRTRLRGPLIVVRVTSVLGWSAVG
jgi:PPOX class probable F420-dependent enzyme